MPASPKTTPRRDLAVVGASAGGVDAMRHLVAALPADHPGAVFLALHMPRRGAERMDDLLGDSSRLPLMAPRRRQRIAAGSIYVAVPDHHLIIDRDFVEVARGPALHRHRPAIDVLFRSAAISHGARVVGVVLTGMLDDGSAGLLEIKRRGGAAIVQDPADARFAEMPRNALESVDVDHCAPLAKIPSLLAQFAANGPGRQLPDAPRDERGVDAPGFRVGGDARPSPYSCPECHGVLWEIRNPQRLSFQCRVGHGYSPETLAAEQDGAVEDALWAAVRSLEEQADMARVLADHWRSHKAEPSAVQLDRKAERCKADAERLRELLSREPDAPAW